jgi:hypothetical protein
LSRLLSQELLQGPDDHKQAATSKLFLLVAGEEKIDGNVPPCTILVGYISLNASRDNFGEALCLVGYTSELVTSLSGLRRAM